MNRNLVLLGANGAALALLAGAWLAPLPVPKPETTKPVQVPPSPASASPSSVARWPEVAPTSRSLFRPVADQAEPPSPVLPSVPPIQQSAEATIALRGILSDGTRWLALIEIEGEAERRLVGRGDRVGSWTLNSVATRSIILSRNGEQQELLLDPPP